MIGHDEDSEIVEETFITEKDIDVVDEIVLEAEIKAIQLCFQLTLFKKKLNDFCKLFGDEIPCPF